LGVIISKDLKCEKQFSEAVKKANRMLGMIKRNFIDSVTGCMLVWFRKQALSRVNE